MTIYTDGLRLEPENLPWEDGASSMGEAVGAHAADAFNTFPTIALSRMAELGEAMAGAPDVTPLGREAGLSDVGLSGSAESAGSFIPGPAPAPLVAIDKARARVKEAGLDTTLTLPDRPAIPEAALTIMMSRARERREREATIARGPTGSGALGVATSFLVSAVDPLNIASAFIPVVGEARYGKMLADAGTRLLPRAAVRARVGAIEGAAGAALMEPLEVLARTQEGQDYRYSEFLQQVMFGAALGTGLHTGVGAIGDVRRTRRGDPLYPFGPGEPAGPLQGDILPPAPVAIPGDPRERRHWTPADYDDVADPFEAPDVPEPAPPARETPSAGGEGADGVDLTRQASPVGERGPLVAAIDDLPARAKEDALRVAIADLSEGRPVSSGEVLAAAAETDPRVAVSLSAARNDFPALPDGAAIAGHGQNGPVLEGFQDRWTEAVDWLRQAQTGDAIGVLAHLEVPGRIDVIWGDETGGLSHIASKHPEVMGDLPERLARMHRIDRTPTGGAIREGRIELRSADLSERATIRTDFDGEKKTWLLTAFDSRAGRGGETPETPAGSPGPGRSPVPPGAGNIAPDGRPVDSARDAFWRELADRPQDPDDIPPAPANEPPAIAPEATARVQAAERAAAEAEAEYRAHEAYLPEDLKQRVDDELKAIDTEATDRAEILNRGAACLTAARD